MSDRAAAELARTRQAIIDHVLRRTRRTAPADITPAGTAAPIGPEAASSSPAGWRLWRAAGERYWQAHPAHALLQLARPGLAAWGHQHPWAFLGGCALAGAALVMARPWKLISVTGLLVAIARTAATQAASHAHPPLKEPS